MSKQSVWTVFRARDNVSSAFKAMSKNSKRFGNDAEASFKRASRNANRFKGITSSILKANAIGQGMALATQGLRAVSGEFVQFDDSVTAAAAKFKDLNLATEDGRKKLLQLKTTARETGAATQFSATEAAQGLDFLAMTGFTSAQAMAALPGTVDLATVANVDLARATDIASDSLGAFGLMTNDTIQLQKNLARVNDVMAKTMTTSNTSMEDLFEAVKKGAPDFTAAGQSMETFNTLLGVMANSSVKGSEAGTKLRNVMVRLAKPTAEAQKELDDLKVKTKDSNKDFRDAVDILADLEKGLKGKGSAERSAALATIFGARQTGGVNILLQEGVKNIRNYRKELQASGGTTTKIADVMRGSLGNQIKSLQSALIELGFKVLTEFEEPLTNALKSAIEWVRTFDINPWIEGFREVIAIIRDLTTLIQAAILVTTAWGVVWTVMNSKMLLTKAGLITLSAVMKVFNVIMTAFGFIMNLSFGGWVLVIGLIIAGVILLYKNWDRVSKFIIKSANAIWNILKNVASIIGKVISGTVNIAARVFSDDEDEKGAAQKNSINQDPLVFRPPNKAEEQSKKMQFKGLLRFENAPPGLQAETSTEGAPPFMIEGLGAN